MLDHPAIELRSITKRFGDQEVVRNVDLSVRRGEFLTLLGASGCGKTTILRMMAGFETPASGVIEIAGRDVTHVPPYKRRIGMVFQNLALFPHLSVGENIAFGLREQRVEASHRRNKVVEALAMVGLPGTEGRSTNQLSGGQRQRVALARALVTNPEVLLLDEPLSALDLKLRRQMQEELKRIQKRLGTTFVFVTHDQEEALTISDRIAVMREGRIEQLDSAETVYLRPANAFVGTALGEANIFSGEQLASFGLASQIRLPAAATRPNALVIVRPERIAVWPAHPTEVRMSAEVVEATFAGAIDTFVLRVGEQSIRARPAHVPGAARPHLGEKVEIGWNLEDCTFVDQV